MKYIPLAIIISAFFIVNTVSLAQGKIEDYFLNNSDAWNETKRLIHKEPVKVVVEDGLDGLGFFLAELTERDEVTLVFITTHKKQKLNCKGFYSAKDKLIHGKNRVVAVVTKNAGSRTKFHYRFLLQRNINEVPVTIYNNGNTILESKYDGSLPVTNISNLSGIDLCEIEIR